MSESKTTAAQRITALEEQVKRLEQVVRIIAPRAFTFPVTDALEEDKTLHEELKQWFKNYNGD